MYLFYEYLILGHAAFLAKCPGPESDRLATAEMWGFLALSNFTMTGDRVVARLKLLRDVGKSSVVSML